MIVHVKLPTAEQTSSRTSVYSHIECDVEGCGKRSPPPAELYAKLGGLRAFGWWIEGGKHRCPEHYDVDAPARGPQYRTRKENEDAAPSK